MVVLMKFRAIKNDDKKGYRIQGIAFSNENEDKGQGIGFVIERVNYPTYKSPFFEFGTEANPLGLRLFDLLNEIFKCYGRVNKVNKVEGWSPKKASVSFKVSFHASWRVEENKWEGLTQEIEKKLGISWFLR